MPDATSAIDRRRGRRYAGYVLLALLSLLSGYGAWTAFSYYWSWRECPKSDDTRFCDLSPNDEARIMVRELRNASMRWRAMRGSDLCPAYGALLRDHELDGPMRADPWGGSYRFECPSDDVRVSSAGPDRTFDTKDDIAAHGGSPSLTSD